MCLPQTVLKSLLTLVVFLLLVGLPLAWCETTITAPPPENVLTKSCDPCTFTIAQTLAPYSVRFKLKNVSDGRRVVEALQVSRADKPDWAESLTVHDMTPVRESDELFIATADINFDGYNDLLFATSRGTANTYADYWLFVPAKQEFDYLGNYPIFTIDSVTHRLSTYERGGYGGMVYQANHYRFVNSALTLVASEKQEATNQEGVYRKSIYRLKEGRLRLIKREIVKAPSSK